VLLDIKRNVTLYVQEVSFMELNKTSNLHPSIVLTAEENTFKASILSNLLKFVLLSKFLFSDD